MANSWFLPPDDSELEDEVVAVWDERHGLEFFEQDDEGADSEDENCPF